MVALADFFVQGPPLELIVDCQNFVRSAHRIAAHSVVGNVHAQAAIRILASLQDACDIHKTIPCSIAGRKNRYAVVIRRIRLNHTHSTDAGPRQNQVVILAHLHAVALAVGPAGEVWAQNAKPSENLTKRLAAAPQANLHPVVASFEHPVPAGMSPLDLITINLNYHDIVNTPTDRAAMNRALFAALKPGGYLVIGCNSFGMARKNGPDIANAVKRARRESNSSKAFTPD